MPTKILGFGHYKQSGKSSICEAIIADYYKIGSLSPYRNIRIYSFADKLKQFCIEVLGLTHEQCYGEDEDKNSLTNLRWEDMPGIITAGRDLEYSKTVQFWFYDNWVSAKDLGLEWKSPGFMTAREVLQYFGTGVCRKMSSNCWVEATMRQIKKDAPDYALIPDMRFPNEADAIKLNGGTTIKFLRRPFPEDNHPSEVSLEDYKFDFVFDNREWTIERKNTEVIETLKMTGWLP